MIQKKKIQWRDDQHNVHMGYFPLDDHFEGVFFFRFTLPYMNRYWMTCYTWGRNDHIFYWTSLIRRLFHHLKHSTVMKLDGFTLCVFPDTSSWSVS